MPGRSLPTPRTGTSPAAPIFDRGQTKSRPPILEANLEMLVHEFHRFRNFRLSGQQHQRAIHTG